jgi:hypothetical protein
VNVEVQCVDRKFVNPSVSVEALSNQVGDCQDVFKKSKQALRKEGEHFRHLNVNVGCIGSDDFHMHSKSPHTFHSPLLFNFAAFSPFVIFSVVGQLLLLFCENSFLPGQTWIIDVFSRESRL